MNENQLSLFDVNIVEEVNKINEILSSNIAQINYDLDSHTEAILISALASQSVSDSEQNLISYLANNPQAKIIASSFNAPQLTRKLKLNRKKINKDGEKPSLENKDNKVFYGNQEIGEIKLLYKTSLPGELQAKLAYLSTIDRFLEYLQTKYYSVVLAETDYHIHIFIPVKYKSNIEQEWINFVEKVLFSTQDEDNDQLPRLPQTFISMLKSVTLAGRGFSTIDVPIITEDQAIILASLYLAVFQQVKKRQDDRKKEIRQLNTQIVRLKQEIQEDHVKDKEKELKTKIQKLEDKQKKEIEEDNKYKEKFIKTFTKILTEHQSLLEELNKINLQLQESSLNKRQINKLKKDKQKIEDKIIFTQNSVNYKIELLSKVSGNPFLFIKEDQKENPDKFTVINQLSKSFNRTATEQINSTRGDIFSQCLLEMYRLLENTKFSEIPNSLLTEKPVITRVRSPGDDGNEFCYSCGVVLDKAQWRVARFMFERPSQRRQSSSSEDRPYICTTCSVLAFASPLKVTDESIIIKLNPKNNKDISKYKIKDYLRMLANKEMHLNSGRYLILTSDKTSKGDIASDKLGQVQYARAKIADIFPLEVLTDFDFSLVLQGSQEIKLESRHLIFIKGLMEGYAQKIIESGKEINSKLGDAIRYIEQDLPYLADYTLAKVSHISSFSHQINLEKVRANYYKQLNLDLNNLNLNIKQQKDNEMNENQLKKRANLYKNVSALTGLLYPFIEYAEYLVKRHKEEEAKKNPQDPEKIRKEIGREVSKIIENVKDRDFFDYYASIGNQQRTIIRANLKRNRDNYFIYDQAKNLLIDTLKVTEIQEKKDGETSYLELTIGDVENAFTYFADIEYSDDKNWREFTYHVKLSLYTRFPELVRLLSSKGDN